MVESQTKLGFLYHAASVLQKPDNKAYDIIRSNLLMRCPEFTNFGETPSNNFKKIRCSHCCLEWKRGQQCKVKRYKLSKRQKKRIKFNPTKKNNLLNITEVEKICSFCGHDSTIQVPKIHTKDNKPISSEKSEIKPLKKQLTVEKKRDLNTQKSLNVYSNISEVFSLTNTSNKLAKTTPPVKVIKNNKKKKDKFAGLCQKAVLEAAKRKTEKEKKDKLNLFLKPSS